MVKPDSLRPDFEEVLKHIRTRSGDSVPVTELSDYLNDRLIPKIAQIYAHFEERIQEVSNPAEILDLKEDRFIKTLKSLSHPEVARRIGLIQELINEQDNSPAHISLVAVGSAVSGGMLMREALGTMDATQTDIDLLAVYSVKEGRTADEAAAYISRWVKTRIGQLINSGMINPANAPEYQLCGAHNVGIMNYEAIESIEVARAMIEQALDSGGDIYHGVNQYFFPVPEGSFDLNLSSRYFLFEALRELAKKDIESWKQVTAKIKNGFRWQGLIKLKHFGLDRLDSVEPNLQKINEYFFSLFDEVLDATSS
jgi:hypothetical protein